MDRNTNFSPASLFDLPVALRKESVDRNTNFSPASLFDLPVALRKESVDRNKKNRPSAGGSAVVALRKESVDRNLTTLGGFGAGSWSLSARRAWIEIQNDGPSFSVRESLSARRAWIEITTAATSLSSTASLSARRAWIEIVPCWRGRGRRTVALRKESVDRNNYASQTAAHITSRSPQGERG